MVSILFYHSSVILMLGIVSIFMQTFSLGYHHGRHPLVHHSHVIYCLDSSKYFIISPRVPSWSASSS
jgi:hypothetical protein